MPSSLSSVLNTGSSAPGHSSQSGGQNALLSFSLALFILLYNVKVSYHSLRKSSPFFIIRGKKCLIVWKRNVQVPGKWGNHQLSAMSLSRGQPVTLLECLKEFIWLASLHLLECMLPHDNIVNMSKQTLQLIIWLFFEKNIYTRNRETCLTKITHEITKQNLQVEGIQKCYINLRLAIDQSKVMPLKKKKKVIWLQMLFF